MNTLRRIAPAALLLGLLTACGTGTPPAPSPAPAAPASTVDDVTPEPVDTEDQTALIVDITWEGTSESDRDVLCAGIAAFGTRWAADRMRDGAGDESVDWDRAAVLVQQKCEQR